MAESLYIPHTDSREQIYQSLLPQIQSLVGSEEDLIANLANTAAVLREAFGFFWVGFYIVREQSLVLGPFQGTLACTRIKYGRGVCGTAWRERVSQLVPDVEQFPGHIACSSLSRSEVVVPILDQQGEVVAVLDVDSDRIDDFLNIDVIYLEQICAIFSTKFK